MNNKTNNKNNFVQHKKYRLQRKKNHFQETGNNDLNHSKHNLRSSPPKLVPTNKGAGNLPRKNDPADNAMMLHKAMLKTSTHEEALKFAKSLETKFPDNTKIIAYLAGWYKQINETEKSASLTQKLPADAQPTEQDANNHILTAISNCLEKDDYDGARDQLRNLENASNNSNTEPFMQVALAYMSIMEIPKAYEVCQTIHKLFPRTIKTDANFRNLVKRIEKILRIKKPICKTGSIIKKLFILIILAGLSYGGYTFYQQSQQETAPSTTTKTDTENPTNQNPDSNNTPAPTITGDYNLYAVNSLNEKVSLKVGKHNVTIPANTYQVLPLDANKYTVTITRQNKPTYTKPITIKQNTDSKLSPMYIFNIQGAGLIFNRTDKKLLYGKEFIIIPHVSQEFNHHTSYNNGKKIKLFFPPYIDAMQELQYKLSTEEKNNYLNYNINHNCNLTDSIITMFKLADDKKNKRKIINLIENKLSSSELNNMPLHNFYISIYQSCYPYAKANKLYRTLLAKSPNNSMLLYYQASIAKEKEKATRLFNKSIIADPKNPYPHYRLAILSCEQKRNLNQAVDHILKAYSLQPQNKQFEELFYHIQCFNESYDTVIEEINKKLAEKPTDLKLFAQKLDILASAKETAKIKTEIVNFRKLLLEQNKKNEIDEINITAAATWLNRTYAIETLLKNIADGIAKQKALFYFNLLTRDPGIAERYVDKTNLTANTCLSLYFVWREVKNDLGSKNWLKKAEEKFSKKSGQYYKIALLIKEHPDNIIEQLNNLYIPIQEKTIIYTLFADLYPTHKTQLLKTAKYFNYYCDFAHKIATKHITYISK